MERYFSLDMPAWRFARNTLVASILGLLPLLALYIALTPGFAAHLFAGGPTLGRFVRQILTNGLPVVFVVNYVGFFLFSWARYKHPGGRGLGLVLLLNMPIRVILFIVLHAVIYVISADWFGSFGGNRLTALRVVAPTLAQSAMFQNISGVYLYATLVSALPLYMATIEGSDRLGKLLSRSPGRMGPLLGALAVFGLTAVFLTAAARMIERLQAG